MMSLRDLWQIFKTPSVRDTLARTMGARDQLEMTLSQFAAIISGRSGDYQTSSLLEFYQDSLPVMAVTGYIARAFADLPFAVLDKETEEETPNHPLLDFLDNRAGGDWDLSPLENWMLQFLLSGDCFLFKNIVGNDDLFRLTWLRSDCVLIQDDRSIGGVTGYIYTGDGSAKYMPDQIIHIKTPNPLDWRNGLSPLESVRIHLTVDHEALKFFRSFFRSAMYPPATLKASDDLLLSGQWDVAKQKLIKAWTESRDEGYPVMLTGDLKELGAKLGDVAAKDIETFIMHCACLAYSMPSELVGISEKSSFNEGDKTATAVKSFYKHCLFPFARPFIKAINKYVLPYFGDPDTEKFTIMKDRIDVFSDEIFSRRQQDTVDVSAGVMKRNEARKNRKLVPVGSEGEILTVTANTVPLTALIGGGDNFLNPKSKPNGAVDG